MRLTEAQKRELNRVSDFPNGTHYADFYTPIKRLLELGFVSKRCGAFGNSVYSITDLGRAALAQSVEKQ